MDAAWEEARAGRSRDRGLRWSANDHRINSNAPGSAYAVDVSVGLEGDRYAVLWADGRAGSADVFYASRELGTHSVWQTPEPE